MTQGGIERKRKKKFQERETAIYHNETQIAYISSQFSFLRPCSFSGAQKDIAIKAGSRQAFAKSGRSKRQKKKAASLCRPLPFSLSRGGEKRRYRGGRISCLGLVFLVSLRASGFCHRNAHHNYGNIRQSSEKSIAEQTKISAGTKAFDKLSIWKNSIFYGFGMGKSRSLEIPIIPGLQKKKKKRKIRGGEKRTLFKYSEMRKYQD